MNPVQMLSNGLSRSRSSSNAASHSRERSATLVSNSTHVSAGTMSTLVPSEPGGGGGGLAGGGAGPGGAHAGGAGAGGGMGASAGPPGAPPPLPPPLGAGMGPTVVTAAAGGVPTVTSASAAAAAAAAGMSGPPPVPMQGKSTVLSSSTSPLSPSSSTFPSNPFPGRRDAIQPSMQLLHQHQPSKPQHSLPLPPPPPQPPPPRGLDMGEALKYMGGSGRGVPTAGREAGQNPDAIYQSIQEASAKRISSLDYLKKTHEPRVFWFNTLLYTQPDIAKLPSFSSTRLSRRATNFLLLGVSLPSVVDLNTQSPTDYLRALNALLIEFEDYERQHPSDGSALGSLTRPRMISSVFRKGTISGKRRTSSAADIGLPMPQSVGGSGSAEHPPRELMSLLSNAPGSGPTSAAAAVAAAAPPGLNGFTIGGGGGAPGVPPLPPGLIPPATSDVIPGGELAAGEDFSWLRTPTVPFEPDFFEVFVTLCDMLIECYSRIAGLVSGPAVCAPETSEFFQKADGKIRRVVFEGIIKEFVEHTRAGVKNEVAGISKIILGGLM